MIKRLFLVMGLIVSLSVSSLSAISLDDFEEKPEIYLPEYRTSELIKSIFELAKVDLNLRVQLNNYIMHYDAISPLDVIAVCILSSADCARGVLGGKPDFIEVQQRLDSISKLFRE